MDGTTYRRVAEIELSPTPDGCVIFDSNRRELHYLNATATAVLELCDGQTGAERIAERVRSAFGLAEAPVQDVRACLALLLDKALIEAVR